MGVGDGDGQRIRFVHAVGRGARQETPHHGADLTFVAVAGADHRLLHRVRRVFGDRKPEKSGDEQRDPPRLAELQSGCGIAIDESLLDRRFRGRKPRQYRLEPIEDLTKPSAQALPVI